jgi:hypothetical protein
MSAMFPIGRLEITRAAEKEARRIFGEYGWQTRLAGLLARHAQGDWGDLNADGKRINDEAVKTGGRLFSAYEIPGFDFPIEFWIITSADRTGTAILMPQDY